ncbi:hypothetical protein J4E91_006264 [Alternaria rosae]|nr:hypothetical protein J4E91_006264 [Alternaria rosae]
MPCKDMYGQYSAQAEMDAGLTKLLKGKYEEDLTAATQELSSLKQETRHIFDIEKENKKTICTNKINELTANIAQLDENLASLDEQIQRLKEELKPPPQLSQSELAERKARHEAHMRAKLARIHGISLDVLQYGV